jgi:hypothetical protein
MADEDGISNRHLGWITAWAAVALLGGAAIIGYWQAAVPSSSKLPVWPVIPFVAVMAVPLYMVFAPLLKRWPFRELHKHREYDEDEIAKGLYELDLLEHARKFVRLILTRNEGRDDLANSSQWNNWAAAVEQDIEQSSMDLWFLQALPDQWRRREIDDDALQLADNELLALIQERKHFRTTAFALKHQARHGA